MSFYILFYEPPNFVVAKALSSASSLIMPLNRHLLAYLPLDLPFNLVNSPSFAVTGQSFVKRQHCALQETSGVDNLVRKEVHLEAIS